MKIKQKRSYRLPALIGLLVLLAIVVGIAWFVRADKTMETSIDLNREDRTLGSAKKNDTTPEDSGATTNSEEKPDQTDVSSAESLGVSISNASQQQDFVAVRALISGATSGECELTLTRSGQDSIKRQAPFSAQADYVICQGFNIPLSDFPVSGDWNVAVTATSNSGTMSGKSTTVTIEVNR